MQIDTVSGPVDALEIRPAVLDDAAEVAAVHIRSFAAAYAHLPRTRRAAEAGLAGRVAWWRSRLQQPADRTVVAYEGDRLKGFVVAGPSPDPDADEATSHVFSIHVDPGSTGQGIGRRLMQAAVGALADGEYSTATLWVVASNDRARRFYERLGWSLDGASRRERLAVGDEDGDEVDVVRYRLDLSAGR